MTEKTRYNDDELEEFKTIINDKLAWPGVIMIR